MNGTTRKVRFQKLSELLSAVRGEALRQDEHAYLLVDGARIGKRSDVIRQRDPGDWACLFGAAPGSPLFEVSPALIRFDEHDRRAWRLLLDTKYRQCAQLLLSPLPLDALARQLANHLYVEEADGTRWVLAFWDPFVMASLIGMQPPANELVPGPVLEKSQIAGLLTEVAGIILQNRDGQAQYIEIPPLPDATTAPFTLSQTQMDMLMDIDLPDRVAEILRNAEPNHPMRDGDLHRLCCRAIQQARASNQQGLDDYCDGAFDMLNALDNEKVVQE